MKRCDQCQYWEAVDPAYGYCHRYPPTVIIGEEDEYPVTNDYEWCGEWKIREDAE